MDCYVDMIISYCRLMLSKKDCRCVMPVRSISQKKRQMAILTFLSKLDYINSPKSVYCFIIRYGKKILHTSILPSVKTVGIFDYLLDSSKVKSGG